MVGNQSFHKKTISDEHLAGKVVLLRADYNVPLSGGKVADDYRLQASLPTVRYILSKNPARLIIISHLGRPEGAPNPSFSLRPVANRLSKLLDRAVHFIDDCVGDAVKQGLQASDAKVVMLENLRFYPGEEQNSADFAKQIVDATGAQVFVADGFGVVHRAHASTDAITKLLPSVSGLLLEHEVSTILGVMHNPARPLVAVVGGAKISDKIEVLNKFIELADCVALGGALANDFLAVQKYKIGASLYDPDALDIARDVLTKAAAEEKKRNFKFMVPTDVVVSTSTDGRKPTRVVELSGHILADVINYPKTPPARDHQIAAHEKIVDVGPVSAARVAGAIDMAATVIWSGTFGITEVKGIAGARDPFGHGTQMIADAMIGQTLHHGNKPFSVVGGGDTVAYVESRGLVADFNHVSTGGSASLELMAGKKLPGVEALQDK